MWMFIVQFFQLLGMYENFHNKKLGGKGKNIITIVIYGIGNLTHYYSQLDL